MIWHWPPYLTAPPKLLHATSSVTSMHVPTYLPSCSFTNGYWLSAQPCCMCTCSNSLWGGLTARFHLRFQMKGENWKTSISGGIEVSIRIWFLFKLVSLYYQSSYLSALYFERKKVFKGIEATSTCKKITCSSLGDRSYHLMQPRSCKKSQDLLHLSHFTTEKERTASGSSQSSTHSACLTYSHLWLSKRAGRELHPLSQGSTLAQENCPSSAAGGRDSLWWKDFSLKKIICSLPN